jgi:hypothetical protein
MRRVWGWGADHRCRVEKESAGEIRPFSLEGKNCSIGVHLLHFEEIFRPHPIEQLP